MPTPHKLSLLNQNSYLKNKTKQILQSLTQSIHTTQNCAQDLSGSRTMGSLQSPYHYASLSLLKNHFSSLP